MGSSEKCWKTRTTCCSCPGRRTSIPCISSRECPPSPGAASALTSNSTLCNAASISSRSPFDVAIRVGEQLDSGRIIRKQDHPQTWLVAHPSLYVDDYLVGSVESRKSRLSPLNLCIVRFPCFPTIGLVPVRQPPDDSSPRRQVAQARRWRGASQRRHARSWL